MPIKPLPGYVLIEPIEDELKSGEVYLPEQSKVKPSTGKVVAMGFRPLETIKTAQMLSDDPATTELVKRHYESIKEGQVVIYKKWTNQEVEHEGKKYLLIEFQHLMAVIE